MSEDNHSNPIDRIEMFNIWLPDDGAYTKLTEQQLEITIQLIIDGFH